MYKMEEFFKDKDLSDFDEDYDDFMRAVDKYSQNPDTQHLAELSGSTQSLYSDIKMLLSNGELTMTEFDAIKRQIFNRYHAALDEKR